MRYLVIGGAGFIGSNLVGRLLSGGSEVKVVDSLTTGSIRNLCGVVPFVVPDSEVLSLSIPVDGIFWVAGPSSSPMYKENTRLVGRAIEGFCATLEYAKRYGARVVYASSSSVYNGNPIPWVEDMPIYITDFYTEVRLAMERLSKLYYDLYGVESVGLRLFAAYGRNEEAKGKYANLITQAMWTLWAGKKFVIYGDGSQTRDFTFADDIVQAFVLAMESGITNNVVNVGTGASYTLNDVLGLIERLSSKKLDREYVPNPISNYVQDTLANTAKAHNMLRFVAKYKLEDGIRILLQEANK